MSDADQRARLPGSLSFTCAKCGESLSQGFARCQNAACRAIRPEFVGFDQAIVDAKTVCVLSGAETDVQLPNGDGLWAPYFLELMDEGMIGPNLSYTPAFYARHPHWKKPHDPRL